MLHEIVSKKPTSLLEVYCSKVNQELNLKQKVNLLHSRDNLGKIPMMLLSDRQIEENINFVSHFWKFTEIYLSSNQQLRNLLLVKDDFELTVLQHSTFSKDVKIFEFVKDLYEVHFDRLEIQNILMVTSKHETRFIERLMFKGRKDVLPKVSEYLENIFYNDKLKLRELIFYQKDGKNLLDVMKLLKSNYYLKTFIERLKEEKCNEEKLKTCEDWNVYLLNCLTYSEKPLKEFSKLDQKEVEQFLLEEIMKMFEKLASSFHYLKSSMNRNVVIIKKVNTENGTVYSEENFILSFFKLLTTTRSLDEFLPNLLKANKNLGVIIDEFNSGRFETGFLAFMNLFGRTLEPNLILDITTVILEKKMIICHNNFLKITRTIITFVKNKMLFNPMVLNFIKSKDDVQIENVFMDLLRKTFDDTEEFDQFIKLNPAQESSIEFYSKFLPIIWSVLKDSNSTSELRDILKSSNGSLEFKFADFIKILDMPAVKKSFDNPQFKTFLVSLLQIGIGNSSIRIDYKDIEENIPLIQGGVKNLISIKDFLKNKCIKTSSCNHSYKEFVDSGKNEILPIFLSVVNDKNFTNSMFEEAKHLVEGKSFKLENFSNLLKLMVKTVVKGVNAPETYKKLNMPNNN